MFPPRNYNLHRNWKLIHFRCSKIFSWPSVLNGKLSRQFLIPDQDCVGGKRSKEHITVALVASATGEKLAPLVIGKTKKPRCFCNINTSSLPVTYRFNRKAWMTLHLMTEWLTTTLDRQSRQNHSVFRQCAKSPYNHTQKCKTCLSQQTRPYCYSP